MELKLLSPVGYEPLMFHWPLPQKEGYDGAKQLVETIKWACHDIPDLQLPLKRNILRNYDTTSYESMKALCQRYNKAIKGVLLLEMGTQMFVDRLNLKATSELLQHILQETYSRAVEKAEELNKYQAFSPDVYGETSFEMIEKMISQCKITKDDVFVDLGSGVGQVVLQMAASTPSKICIGIEKNKVPNKYAKEMTKQFEFWMKWFGKKYGKFELHEGDFFEDKYRAIINESTIVFVNNFAFGPAIDHRLKERFADFKDGTKIVSSKSFSPLNFRITDRNLSDIGTILRVSEITPKYSSVSWTGKPISFYLHIIDRTRLELYFQTKKEQKSQSTDSYKQDKILNGDLNNCDSSEDEEYVPSAVLKNPSRSKRQNNLCKNEPIKNGFKGFESIPRVQKVDNHNGSSKKQEKIIPGLQELLDSYKAQYTELVESMASPQFRSNLQRQIESERRKNIYLKCKIKELEKEIDTLFFTMKKRIYNNI